MNLSNGRCPLCKESNIQEDLQHLFFKCITCVYLTDSYQTSQF
jgi:hypothetical protein